MFGQERFIGAGMVDFDDVEGVTIDDNSVDSRYYTDADLTWDGGKSNNLSWQLRRGDAGPMRGGASDQPPLTAMAQARS